jgi:hypothetical protein
VRFFSLMFQHAQRAGVDQGAPEMQHFSRWVFANARQCGAMGDADGARGCFDVAIQASGGDRRDLKTYRAVSNLIGWTNSGRLCNFVEGLRAGWSGKSTKKLSWMEQ